MFRIVTNKTRIRKEKPIQNWDLKYDPETNKVSISDKAFETYFKDCGISLAVNDEAPNDIFIRIHADNPQYYETSGSFKRRGFKGDTKFVSHIFKNSNEVTLEEIQNGYFQILNVVNPTNIEVINQSQLTEELEHVQ